MSRETKCCSITGSGGFVGRNLIDYLANKSSYRIQPIKLTYETAESVKLNGEIVIHLAGKAHDLNNVLDAEQYYIVNYELTRKLYLNFLASDAKKFIFISSVKAVADHISETITENTIVDPKSDYGKSKLMAEQFIQAQHLPVGKSYYILRPCMIHGAGNKGNLNLLYNLISKGMPYPLAAFENKRSFLSVENLCFVIYELLNRNDIPSGIYNLADNESISTNELVNIIASTCKRKPLLLKLSPGFIRLIVTVGSFLKLPFTIDRLKKLTENYIVDSHKIRNVIGKNFPVNTREGIIKTVKSFQE